MSTTTRGRRSATTLSKIGRTSGTVRASSAPSITSRDSVSLSVRVQFTPLRSSVLRRTRRCPFRQGQYIGRTARVNELVHERAHHEDAEPPFGEGVEIGLGDGSEV